MLSNLILTFKFNVEIIFVPVLSPLDATMSYLYPSRKLGSQIVYSQIFSSRLLNNKLTIKSSRYRYGVCLCGPFFYIKLTIK